MNSKLNKSAYLFLKYLIEEGKFNPENYESILELGQSVPNSLSRYLTKYNQYILSKKVNYDELNEANLNGANGYLKLDGIFVPKSLINDKYYLEDAPKVPYIRHGYNYPSIDEFGSIICEGISLDVYNACFHEKDIFIGYIENLNNENELLLKRKFYNRIFEAINLTTGRNYIMKTDIDSKLEKEYCLIKRK